MEEEKVIPVLIRYHVCKDCGFKDEYDKFPWISPDGTLENSRYVCPKCGSTNLDEVLEEVKGWEEKLKELSSTK